MPSVQTITENMGDDQCCQFRNLDRLEVENPLHGLNPRKSTGWDGLPPMAFKIGAQELSWLLTSLYNSCISSDV